MYTLKNVETVKVRNCLSALKVWNNYPYININNLSHKHNYYNA